MQYFSRLLCHVVFCSAQSWQIEKVEIFDITGNTVFSRASLARLTLEQKFFLFLFFSSMAAQTELNLISFPLLLKSLNAFCHRAGRENVCSVSSHRLQSSGNLHFL